MNDHFEIETSGNVKVITILKDLILGSWMEGLIEEVEISLGDNTTNFIIDLHHVNLINSTGISTLVNMLTKSRRSGGDVVLCAVSEKVQQLLVITKLNAIFNIKNNITEAKLHFKSN